MFQNANADSRSFRRGLLLACAALVATAGPLAASGTYPPVAPAKPPSRPGEKVVVDNRTYEIGKRVYQTRARVADFSAVRANEQRPVLQRWQSRLPWPSNQFVDLTTLAGCVTEDQLRSLEYYLAIRFRMRTN